MCLEKQRRVSSVSKQIINIVILVVFFFVFSFNKIEKISFDYIIILPVEKNRLLTSAVECSVRSVHDKRINWSYSIWQFTFTVVVLKVLRGNRYVVHTHFYINERFSHVPNFQYPSHVISYFLYLQRECY